MSRVSHILTVVTLASTAAVVVAQSSRTGQTRSGIAYELEGRGPVVVLITGSNLARRMWTKEAQWLSRSFTVVRYDLRAHGASDTATVPVAALQKHDYRQAAEVLVHSRVFAVPGEQAALVRQMVTENDRLWSVPREFMRPNDRPALGRLHEMDIPAGGRYDQLLA